ncbi:hypothetical protein E2C01_033214 [Portunus trituberculatus]|uniref:Uncharacterized protein n=1 Tax=Portunus trituberculatus TaxID=210409 RepID=A0A5B7F362_PORTR|nr:hypothetical protein [Portunus trituberculatus]
MTVQSTQPSAWQSRPVTPCPLLPSLLAAPTRFFLRRKKMVKPCSLKNCSKSSALHIPLSELLAAHEVALDGCEELDHKGTPALLSNNEVCARCIRDYMINLCIISVLIHDKIHKCKRRKLLQAAPYITITTTTTITTAPLHTVSLSTATHVLVRC